MEYVSILYELIFKEVPVHIKYDFWKKLKTAKCCEEDC